MGLCRCVVQGCKSKSSTNAIFSIPRIRKYHSDITYRRRLLWLKRLNLPDTNVSKTGVCDQHFISGKPAHYIEESNPDWAPTQNIGSKNLIPKSALDRYIRRNKFLNMKGNRTKGLKNKNGSRVVDLDLPTVSGSSGNSSLDKKKLEIAGKITHQIPGVLKKPEELIKFENENQLDIFWMNKLPVKNSSKISYGKVIKLGETNNSNVVTQSLKLNVQKPLLPVKKVGYPKGGLDPKQKYGESSRRPMVIVPLETLEQVMRNPCEDSLLFISNNATNDHNYCAKSAIQKGHHIFMDHNYCQSFHSNESSPIPENISEFMIDTSMQNPLELTDEEIRKYAGQVYQNELRPACKTNTNSVILSDDKGCSTCDEVAYLKSELEKKSLSLEAGMNGVNSLKQELELAKEHINNLRAQLEQNTRTLWSYCR